ncbi:MAG: endonuclease domain-containing protein [Leptolyngbya sp. SIOISBB]|nr:endonuclease domain-containing protein [Leptolyngbya sp. SIOISBB]
MAQLNNSDFHLPYNPALAFRAKELRKSMTPAEKKLWYQYLRNFKHRVLRQRPIDHFIVDFYCPHLKLIIEVDGDSHFNETARAYDLQRSQTLAGYGLQVIRFTNEQVFGQFEAVCASIKAAISPVK